MVKDLVLSLLWLGLLLWHSYCCGLGTSSCFRLGQKKKKVFCKTRDTLAGGDSKQLGGGAPGRLKTAAGHLGWVQGAVAEGDTDPTWHRC